MEDILQRAETSDAPKNFWRNDFAFLGGPGGKSLEVLGRILQVLRTYPEPVSLDSVLAALKAAHGLISNDNSVLAGGDE